MFPRKEACSTLWKSAPSDLQTTGVDAFRLQGSITFGVQPLRGAVVQGRTRSDTAGKLATQTSPFNGDGGFIDPVPARAMHPAPAQSPALQEPSASVGQVIA
jgi:hypothetical protein